MRWKVFARYQQRRWDFSHSAKNKFLNVSRAKKACVEQRRSVHCEKMWNEKFLMWKHVISSRRITYGTCHGISKTNATIELVWWLKNFCKGSSRILQRINQRQRLASETCINGSQFNCKHLINSNGASYIKTYTSTRRHFIVLASNFQAQ